MNVDVLDVKKAKFDEQEINNVELVSIFQLHRRSKRKTKKTPYGVLELALFDDWAEEIMMHMLHGDPRSPKGKFPKSKHNYFLLRMPVNEEGESK